MILQLYPANDDDNDNYQSWLADSAREYVESRRPPYNIVFLFGDDKQVHVIDIIHYNITVTMI